MLLSSLVLWWLTYVDISYMLYKGPKGAGLMQLCSENKVIIIIIIITIIIITSV